MSTTKFNDEQLAERILGTFAQYGFQKTSMEDISKAAGISRQSVYKKFGSKEKCYAWSIQTYLTNMYMHIFAALNENDISPHRTLQKVFNIFIGKAIDMVSRSHGMEILDDVQHSARNSAEDWTLRLRSRLAEYLERHALVSADRSKGMALVLICAGKGVLMERPLKAQFSREMKLIIESVRLL